MKRWTLIAIVGAVGAGALAGAWFSSGIREREPQAQAAQTMAPAGSPEAGLPEGAAPVDSTPPDAAAAAAHAPAAVPFGGEVSTPATASRKASAARTASRARPAAPRPVERVEVNDDPWSDSAEQREAEERAREERAFRLTLPAGTELRLVLENGLSSETSQAGDAVTARVERATDEDGRVLLPGGAVLKGRVIEARSAGRVSGRSRIAVAFDEIVVRGRSHPLSTTEIAAEGERGVKRDAAVIGGSAAVGAIIGGIADGGKGAKKGAVIGGAMGTGAVLATRGKEVELPAGSRWTVRVREGARF